MYRCVYVCVCVSVVRAESRTVTAVANSFVNDPSGFGGLVGSPSSVRGRCTAHRPLQEVGPLDLHNSIHVINPN